MAKVTGADTVVKNFQRIPRALIERYAEIMTEEAAIIKERMQAEHVWQNRTFLAERSLECFVERRGSIISIVAKHGAAVHYGWRLETMQDGRFAVLRPTMRSEWPKVLERLRAARVR